MIWYRAIFGVNSSEKSRDVLRPRDFRSVIVRKSRNILRPRDFRSQPVRKSRDVLRPQDFWSLAVRKSRGSFRPRDFRSIIVRKSRNYLSTKVINSKCVVFQSTVIILKKDYSSMMYIKYIFITLCFVLKMTMSLRRYVNVAITWQGNHTTMRMISHDDDNEATMQTHNNNEATIWQNTFTTQRDDERLHHATIIHNKKTRTIHDTAIHNNATTCNTTAHDTITRWADKKTWRRDDAMMQRYDDMTCCKNLCWCQTYSGMRQQGKVKNNRNSRNYKTRHWVTSRLLLLRILSKQSHIHHFHVIHWDSNSSHCAHSEISWASSFSLNFPLFIWSLSTFTIFCRVCCKEESLIRGFSVSKGDIFATLW